jgi:LUD domain
MSDYTTIASDEIIAQTAKALKENGFSVKIVENLEAVKSAMDKIIPKDSEVFTVTSKTLQQAGLEKFLNESGNYYAVRPKMMELAQKQPDEVKKRKLLTAVPDYIVGSAAAVTQDGHIMVASATGSQIAPEVYGANHVVYVISAQKIVKDIDDGIKRIKDYIFPQEQERVHAVYGSKDIKTYFSKLLVYFEDFENRVQVILIKEPAGF